MNRHPTLHCNPNALTPAMLCLLSALAANRGKLRLLSTDTLAENQAGHKGYPGSFSAKGSTFNKQTVMAWGLRGLVKYTDQGWTGGPRGRLALQVTLTPDGRRMVEWLQGLFGEAKP